jgi:hypothetical protein
VLLWEELPQVPSPQNIGQETCGFLLSFVYFENAIINRSHSKYYFHVKINMERYILICIMRISEKKQGSIFHCHASVHYCAHIMAARVRPSHL